MDNLKIIEKTIFINCPFDIEYKQMLRALTFGFSDDDIEELPPSEDI